MLAIICQKNGMFRIVNRWTGKVYAYNLSANEAQDSVALFMSVVGEG